MPWPILLALAAWPSFAPQSKPIPPERDARRPENQNQPPLDAAAGRPAPVQAAPTRERRSALVDPAQRQRELANHVARLESDHRSRVARLERLVEVYAGLGDSAKVQQCEELRARWLKQYKGALNAYKKSFAPEAWRRLVAGLGIQEPA
ncbi:MAG: hypothetical protein RL112_2683 [Planctomycetota bacterium]|jgi:hypothetical protein